MYALAWLMRCAHALYAQHCGARSELCVAGASQCNCPNQRVWAVPKVEHIEGSSCEVVHGAIVACMRHITLRCLQGTPMDAQVPFVHALHAAMCRVPLCPFSFATDADMLILTISCAQISTWPTSATMATSGRAPSGTENTRFFLGGGVIMTTSLSRLGMLNG